MSLAIHVLRDAGAVLGEGALWDAARQGLWWVDIKSGRLHFTAPSEAEDQAWALPSSPGCLAVLDDGALLVACKDGLRRFEPAAGRLSAPVPIEPDRPGNRANDGKPGPDGAFWVGTMGDGLPGATGALYRLLPGAPPALVQDGIGVPNALCWSPDRRTLYHADSRQRRVMAHGFDPATGTLGPARLLLDIAACGLGDGAVPDGATVDAEGLVWIAVWDGGCLLAVTPDGAVRHRIALPVRRPTCPAFGGPGLRQLFVTSASFGLDGPGEGALLVLDGLERPGLPEPVLHWPGAPQ